MKKITGILIAMFMVVSLISVAGNSSFGPGECIAGDLGPVLSVGTPMVKMSKKSKVIIMGAGFKPGQEINILFVTADGMLSDVGNDLKPTPVPDKAGAWTTTWSAGRFVSKKLIKGGAYKIIAADSDYKPVAHAPVFFAKEKKK